MTVQLPRYLAPGQRKPRKGFSFSVQHSRSGLFRVLFPAPSVEPDVVGRICADRSFVGQGTALVAVPRARYARSDLARDRRFGLANGQVRVLRRIDWPHRRWRRLGWGSAFEVGGERCRLHASQMREWFLPKLALWKGFTVFPARLSAGAPSLIGIN
jgi:hypothetical protein